MHIVEESTLDTFRSGELQVRLKVDGTCLPILHPLRSFLYAMIAQYAERSKICSWAKAYSTRRRHGRKRDSCGQN